MYLKITRNFFLNQKARFLGAVISVTFLIVTYMYMNTVAGSAATEYAVPEFMFTTEVIDPYKWRYLEDYDPDFVARFAERIEKEGKVIPVTQRFMVNYMHPIWGDYRFHLLGVPEEFINEQLDALIVSGSPPQPGELGVVMGNTAAQQFQVQVGHTFQTTAGDDPVNDTVPYKVVGILTPDAYSYFDRAVFVVRETHESQTGVTIVPNTLFVYLQGNLSTEEVTTRYAETDGHPNINVAALKESNYGRLLRTVSSFLLVGLCSLTLYQSLQVILNNSARRIGLLKAMGMSDFHVTIIFTQGVLAVFLLAVVLSSIITTILFHYLNQEIGSMLQAQVNLYRLDMAVILSLLGMLLIVLMVIVLTILYRTRRVPPRQVMLEI